jgi:hypothetical protein
MALATVVIATSLTLSSTLAANINLNNSRNYEFGQGIVITTACTGADSLTVTPSSNYENSSGVFKLSAITFSRVPDSCRGFEFKISIYSDNNLLNLDTDVQIARVIYRGASTSAIFKGATGSQAFTNSAITGASVSNGYGTFKIRLTGTPSASLDIQKITLESSCSKIANSLLYPGTSAYQIHKCNPGAANGLYWIQNENINAGAPIQIYADMTRDGGGWTLILANSRSDGWNTDNAITFNATTPPDNPLDLASVNRQYSILSYADYIKKSPSGFQYRIEATNPGEWGGVWTANQNYSFVSQLNTNTNITLNTKFGNWIYNDGGIEERMPYYAPGGEGIITTSFYPGGGAWWGTLVTGDTNWGPAPWEANLNPNPGIIWYWVR